MPRYTRSMKSRMEAEEDFSEDELTVLNTRQAESMAQIERGEGIPGDQILQVLAVRRAVHKLSMLDPDEIGESV